MDLNTARQEEIQLHRDGVARYPWRIVSGAEYMREQLPPDRNFVVRFVDACERDSRLLFTHSHTRYAWRETRTSYRVSLTLGPIYDSTGYTDGYQDVEIIFYKDRPIRNFSLVYKQPDRIGRKHDLKDPVTESIIYALDSMDTLRWIYERKNGELFVCDVAEESKDWAPDRQDHVYALTHGSRYTVCFGQTLEDALDTFADSGTLGQPFPDSEVKRMYAEFPDDGPGAYGYALLGSASECFDLNYLWINECVIDKETGFLRSKETV